MVLVLSRQLDEEIVIQDGLATVKIIEIGPTFVRLGITADRSVPIDRLEIHRKKAASCRPASPPTKT